LTPVNTCTCLKTNDFSQNRKTATAFYIVSNEIQCSCQALILASTIKEGGGGGKAEWI